MAYVRPNCKSKKDLKEAIKSGINVTVFQPGLGTVPHNGTICVEGPHYPAAHTWYAEVTIQDGKVVKVK